MLVKDKKAIDKIRRNLNLAWGTAYDLNKQNPCGDLLGKIEESLTRLGTLEENLNESFSCFPKNR